MSGDEVVVFLLSLGAGPLALAIWFYRLAQVKHLGRQPSYLPSLALVVIAGAAVLGVVLLTLAAPDVRTDPTYLALYLFLGLAWMRASEFAFAFVGVSGRDDVVERRNSAALPVVGGAMLGATCCYAGGNIGAGPGWWVVVFSAGLASVGLVAVWLVMDRATKAAERVTIDRDRGAGARIGGLLIACGLILGRAVAGDWISAEATVLDFAMAAWPVVPLLVAGIAVERGSAPVHVPSGPDGRISAPLPAIGYLAVAALYVIALGWPA